jgi:hypothetical protein
MSPAFSRHLTADSAQFMSFGFHTCLTVDSEWLLTLGSLGPVTDALPLMRQKSLLQAFDVALKTRWRGENQSPVPQRLKFTSLCPC